MFSVADPLVSPQLQRADEGYAGILANGFSSGPSN